MKFTVSYRVILILFLKNINDINKTLGAIYESIFEPMRRDVDWPGKTRDR